MAAACVAGNVICVLTGGCATAITAVGCAGACLTVWSGVTTAGCAACLSANAGIVAVVGASLLTIAYKLCNCVLDDCLENCNAGVRTPAGAVTACF